MEELYSELEQAILKIPKNDIRITQSNWNAKIGTDAYEDWADVTGRFAGSKTTKERGLRLLDFARMHNLVVTNTRYPHKMSPGPHQMA